MTQIMTPSIVCKVSVDRSKDPRSVLEDTGRIICSSNDDVVKSMPRGEGKEVEVVIFRLEQWEYTTLRSMDEDDEGLERDFVSDIDLEKALNRRGLKACDPYSLAAFNEANPAFADERPNGTHWQDENGNWHFASFGRWGDERFVNVERERHGGWYEEWSFAGLDK